MYTHKNLPPQLGVHGDQGMTKSLQLEVNTSQAEFSHDSSDGLAVGNDVCISSLWLENYVSDSLKKETRYASEI
jgi:hypothetical protein